MSLAYATRAGRTLLDRELYLPKGWTEDRDRRREAGIGDEVAFATKPEPASTMITRALDAGCRPGGSPGTRCMGSTPGCDAPWRSGRCRT